MNARPDNSAAIAALRARRAARGDRDPLNRLSAHIARAIANGAEPVTERRPGAMRYSVETSPNGATYVRDNRERCLAHGPHRTPGESAYECDRMRRPTYHDGRERPAWAALAPYARQSWERNPTPR